MSTADELPASPALAMARSAEGDTAARDRFIALAAEDGESATTIGRHIGLSRQQVHAVLEREGSRSVASPDVLRVRRAITRALDDLTDHVSFEELVQVLLADVDPTIRPLGRVGDRGRDGAADLGDGDGAIVSISLEREWSRKIRSEISKIARLGHRPPRVYGVTNRRITRAAEQRLEAFAAERGITLRLLGQQWLATKLLHPQYAGLPRTA
jgi:hypothetical protein